MPAWHGCGTKAALFNAGGPSGTMSLKLTVIIVSYNTEGLLRQCLGSFMNKGAGIPFEVIVVDNASSDGSARVVEEEFPSARLVKNAQNIGFSKANNQGLELAEGEYILFLNSDTVITDAGIFAKWVGFMDAHPESGASGCKLVFPDGSHQVGDAGFKPSLSTAAGYAFFLSKVFPGVFKGLFINNNRGVKAAAVDWVCGAGLMARKSVLEKTGPFNEEIFMYAEDVDLGCRITSFGYKVYYLPYMAIIHLQGSSMRENCENLSYEWLKNLKALYVFYGGRRTVALYDLIISAGLALRVFIYYLMSFAGKGHKHRLKAQKLAKYLLFVIKDCGSAGNVLSKKAAC